MPGWGGGGVGWELKEHFRGGCRGRSLGRCWRKSGGCLGDAGAGAGGCQGWCQGRCWMCVGQVLGCVWGGILLRQVS